MKTVIIIICIISALCGLECIDYNQNNEIKHNLLLGTIGYMLVICVPIALLGISGII